MLQLPQQPGSRLPRTRGAIVARASIKSARTSARPTTTEKLIADFRAAKRAWKKAARELQALYDRHPDLRDHLPAVLLYTKTSGEEVFAASMPEAERMLPPSYDEIKPGYPILREDFARRLGLAREKHREARKCVGIKEAEKRELDAFFRMKSAFQTLCRHKPKSIQAIAMVASVVRQEMSDVVGCARRGTGSLYGGFKTSQDYPDWRSCRSEAVNFFAAFLSTLSKAG